MDRATKKPTQCDRILEHLERYGSITPLEAWQRCGVYRLGARIYDLRHQRGIEIKKDTVSVKNQFGEDCRVAQYKLEVAK